MQIEKNRNNDNLQNYRLYRTIAESINFIVLDKYTKEDKIAEGYQSAAERCADRANVSDIIPLTFYGAGRRSLAAALGQGGSIRQPRGYGIFFV